MNAIIFDNDGVLVDSEPATRAAPRMEKRTYFVAPTYPAPAYTAPCR